MKKIEGVKAREKRGEKEGGGGCGWGHDVVKMTPSALTNWTFSEPATLAILLQTENFIDHTDATIFNRWYARRRAEAIAWRFNVVAFQWVLEL